jgi:hypothetical protein
MTTFPTQLDHLPQLSDFSNLGDPASTVTPASAITQINTAIQAVESQVGFSVLGGGDTRVDGTVLAASPGRTLLVLSGSCTVPQINNGTFAFLIPMTGILTESRVLLARPVLVVSPADLSPFASVQSPTFTQVRRASGTVVQSNLVVLPDGTTSLVVVLNNNEAPFVAGEVLSVTTLMLGGA